MQKDLGFEFGHDFSFIYFSLCLTVKLWELEFKGNHVFKEKYLAWNILLENDGFNNSCRYYESFWNASIYVNNCTEMLAFI